MTTPAEIPLEVLGWFQELGCVPVPEDRAAVLEKLRSFDSVNRFHWNSWDAAIAAMTEEQLTALAKGVVRAEKDLRWSGGSVGAAIWVFRNFARRFPHASDALAEWMLLHSDNPWVPFGLDRGDARSLTEYQKRPDAKIDTQSAITARVRSEQELSKLREASRNRMAAYHHGIHSAQTLARRKLLDELRKCPLTERLAHIAWDDSHPLAFYPCNLLDGLLDSREALNSESLRYLIVRASERETGTWYAWLRNFRASCSKNEGIYDARVLDDICRTRP